MSDHQPPGPPTPGTPPGPTSGPPPGPPPPPGAPARATPDADLPAPREPLDDRERALDPRIVQVWRVGTGLAWVFPLAAPAVAAPILVGWWGGLLTVALLGSFAALVVAWPPARYRRWHWQLTDLALELRHGVVVHRHQAVPYFRIQQIDVTQGPIDRLLGLASLQVTTASVSGSASLPGIPADEAPSVRVELLERASAAVAEHDGELRDAV